MWPFKKRGSIEDPQVPISAPNILQLLGWDTSGVSVNADKALSVPAVWSAINFLSGTIAALPLHVYRRTADGREKRDTDPLYRLLHDAPNPRWTSYRWRKYLMTQTLLRGRSYTFIERNGARRPINLWPLNPKKVTVKAVDDDNGPTTLYKYDNGGEQVTYQAEEIIDIPFMLDADQTAHVDPISRLKSALGLAIALQEYAENYFHNGGVPPLVLTGPFSSPAAIKRAGVDVQQAIKAAAKENRAILPLPDGHKLEPVGFNAKDSQMTEARRFQLEEIARVYDLPPVFLQDLTHGTYSNTEQQDLHFVKHTLTQWLRCLEQEMNLKLFAPSNRRDFVEFNVDGLLRGDFKTRMEGYASAVQNSIKTPNEIRAKENDPPLPGGDSLYIQQNMQGLNVLPANDEGQGDE